VDDEHANPARAIYGTILVMAVITAISHDKGIGPGEIIAAVAATTVVFWLAHVYAEVLGARMEGETGPVMANIRAAMRSEWPLVEAALLPVLGLLLGVIGIVGRDAAVNIAIGAGVVELFAWGIAAGRKLELSTKRTIVVGVVNGAFGLLMVALKVLVH
jgi:hypothetical protein